MSCGFEKPPERLGDISMAADSAWTVLVEWEDLPVFDATEIVVQADCEVQAIEKALAIWGENDGSAYSSCRVLNTCILARDGVLNAEFDSIV